jgi:hypothetical protein
MCVCVSRVEGVSCAGLRQRPNRCKGHSHAHSHAPANTRAHTHGRKHTRAHQRITLAPMYQRCSACDRSVCAPSFASMSAGVNTLIASLLSARRAGTSSMPCWRAQRRGGVGVTTVVQRQQPQRRIAQCKAQSRVGWQLSSRRQVIHVDGTTTHTEQRAHVVGADGTHGAQRADFEHGERAVHHELPECGAIDERCCCPEPGTLGTADAGAVWAAAAAAGAAGAAGARTRVARAHPLLLRLQNHAAVAVALVLRRSREFQEAKNTMMRVLGNMAMRPFARCHTI